MKSQEKDIKHTRNFGISSSNELKKGEFFGNTGIKKKFLKIRKIEKEGEPLYRVMQNMNKSFDLLDSVDFLPTQGRY